MIVKSYFALLWLWNLKTSLTYFLNWTVNWTSAAAYVVKEDSPTCSLKPNPFAYYMWFGNSASWNELQLFCLTKYSGSEKRLNGRPERFGSVSICHAAAELSDLISSTALITRQMGTERSVTQTKTNPRLDYGSCGVRVRVRSERALFWLSVQKQIVLDCWAHKLLFTPAPRLSFSS